MLVYGCQTLLADTIREQVPDPDLREHKTNHFVRNMVGTLVGHLEALLATVKLRKLVWCVHVILACDLVEDCRGRRDGQKKK